MLKVKLPDETVLEFDHSVTPRDVAAKIGARLAKATLAAEVNGVIRTATIPLPENGDEPINLRLLTNRDAEALGVMRHSCAHIMARAVMRVYQGVQLAFGPTIENGFYYDFELPEPISEEDFPKIEAEMAKIIKEDEPFEWFLEPREGALDLVRDLHQDFKVEHISTGLKDEETLSFYRQGEFVDLCRGPHIPSAGAIGAFKLLSVAGAYWKGDASNKQLQRLYGTAWFNKKDQDAYLEQLEEAKRRDHRVLGKRLGLFTTSNLVGSGLILWMPKGAVIRNELENFIRDELVKRGYERVYTPHIGRVDMYKTSGHFPYYADSQFSPIYGHPVAHSVQQLFLLLREEKISKSDLVGMFEVYLRDETPTALRPVVPGYSKLTDIDEKIEAISGWLWHLESYLLKPMNCPHHIQIFKALPRSYRDLPVRLAEFGTVYRYEQSGELGGMTRVRGFTQDDAHLFCTADQVADEFRGCMEMTLHVLKTLGLDDYRVRLGFRDRGSDKYVGGDEVWNRAEDELAGVCKDMSIDANPEPGEAAFYGPKADFVVRDCLGREWQLGTVQLDYNLPSKDRFELEYVGTDNRAHQPVMIHRAPLGSMERFIGVLIEHFAGAFPLWLAPEQVRVLVVSEKSEAYARGIERQLHDAGFRVTGDYRAEKIGAKIRDAQLELIPYMLVIGQRDEEAGTVSVRDRIEGDLGAMPVAQAIAKFQAEIAERTIRQVVKSSVSMSDQGGSYEY